MSAPLVLLAAAFAGLGLLAGALHFALLSRSVALIAGGVRSLPLLAAAPLLRAATTGGVLVFAALHGSTPLLAAFAGFLVARSASLRRLRSA